MTTEQHVGRLACHRWQWRGREHSPQVGCVVGGEGPHTSPHHLGPSASTFGLLLQTSLELTAAS